MKEHKRIIRCQGRTTGYRHKDYVERIEQCPPRVEIIEEVTAVPVISQEDIDKYKSLPRGRSQSLAKKTGISQGVLIQAFRGDKVSPERLGVISKALDEMVEENGEAKPEPVKVVLSPRPYERIGDAPCEGCGKTPADGAVADPYLRPLCQDCQAKVSSLPAEADAKNGPESSEPDSGGGPPGGEVGLVCNGCGVNEGQLHKEGCPEMPRQQSLCHDHNAQQYLIRKVAARAYKDGYQHAFSHSKQSLGAWTCAEKLADLLAHMVATYGEDRTLRLASAAWQDAKAANVTA